ncbi:hypothetical protein [Agrobacterium leguminum]|uniref:hypothetical protein n=1 Tax=Agrobacterium leguminum TaxID=2792015 RepID=UPI003CE4D59E
MTKPFAKPPCLAIGVAPIALGLAGGLVVFYPSVPNAPLFPRTETLVCSACHSILAGPVAAFTA